MVLAPNLLERREAFFGRAGLPVRKVARLLAEGNDGDDLLNSRGGFHFEYFAYSQEAHQASRR